MKILETERLIVRCMAVTDAEFMLALLNTPGWLRFIGDRNVRTLADARDYILKGPVDMVARLGFGFHIVEMKEERIPVGMCGLAKRDYLDDADIGFAMLPQYCGRGYAHEAAAAVLAYAKNTLGLQRIVATTRLDNHASARLLEKLGLRFERTFMHPEGDRALRLFATAGTQAA